MLKNTRLTYFILIISIIFLGVLSRKISGVPTFFGDSLYAIMIYFGVRFLFIHFGFTKNITYALAICFCIEFLQLYRAEWILSVRRTTLGHYVLGQGFLWSDLGFYTIGILIAVFVDFILIKRK